MSEALDRTWRVEGARIVAALARRLGRLDLAEDAAQDALAMAIRRWPIDGTPANPGAWLATTAWRRALDLLRSERRRRTTSLDDDPSWSGSAARDTVVIEPSNGEHEEEQVTQLADLRREDDLLALICACCHPALAAEARVALTLRHVAGLTADEIATAFLVPLATMEKRLVRARRKVRDTGIRFEVPAPAALSERVADVQAVIYLVFNEGYLASGDGAPVRDALCDDALWLARQLHTLLPRSASTRGLLALLLIQQSRRPARESGDGVLVPFASQDRSRWNHAAIEEARVLLAGGDQDELSSYQVEAAIALLHATATSADTVPWRRIAELYALLARLADTPVIAVNHAYARGRAGDVTEALQALDALAAIPELAQYAPRLAAQADLLERAGQREAARQAWLGAQAVVLNAHQRAVLQRRADDLA